MLSVVGAHNIAKVLFRHGNLNLQREAPGISLYIGTVLVMLVIFSNARDGSISIVDIATGFFTGLIGTLTVFISATIWAFSQKLSDVDISVGDAKKSIDLAQEQVAKEISSIGEYVKDVENSVGKVDAGVKQVFSSGQLLAASSVRALENALRLAQHLDTGLARSQSATVSEGVSALGLNYGAWIKHIEGLEGQDEIIKEIWLQYLTTYYREEAFDLGQSELVTNTRNFCFLLVATLSTLLTSQNKTVVHYSVTPVHPKDWYNWPHGLQSPRAYFEEDFFGQYRRTLTEMILWAQEAGKSLEHGRFLLTTSLTSEAQREAKRKRRFGWPIDSYESVEQFSDFNNKILNVALPRDQWGDMDCDFAKSLKEFYKKMSSEDFFGGLPQTDKRCVVPLWHNNWVSNQSLSTEVQAVCQTFSQCSGSCAAQLRQKAKVIWKIDVESAQQAVKALVSSYTQSDEGIKLVWSEISSQVDEEVDEEDSVCPTVDIIKFMDDVHKINVFLRDSPEAYTHLDRLLLGILKYREAKRCAGTWETLNSVFTKTLHSDPELAHYVKLTEEQIKNWPVEQEFTIFGVRDEENEDIQWLLVLASNIQYPFEVAKVNIKMIHPNDVKTEEHCVLVDQLIRASKSDPGDTNEYEVMSMSA